MAWKVFQNNTALTAEDLNDVIVEQGMITFADATARNNAIPSPNPGMHCHLLSTKRSYYYDATNGWIELMPGAVSGLTQRGLLVCTSTTRPAHAAGREIYETDTKRSYMSDGTAWTQKQPTSIAVRGQSVGTVAPGLNTVTVTIAGGKAMPSANYVVNVVTRELQNDWGGALYTTYEAVSLTATTFKVRMNNGFGSSLGCFVDYVLTETTA